MNYSFKDPKPSQITWDRNPERPGLTLGQPAELKNIAGRLDSIWSCPFALVRPGRLHGLTVRYQRMCEGALRSGSSHTPGGSWSWVLCELVPSEFTGEKGDDVPLIPAACLWPWMIRELAYTSGQLCPHMVCVTCAALSFLPYCSLPDQRARALPHLSQELTSLSFSL